MASVFRRRLSLAVLAAAVLVVSSLHFGCGSDESNPVVETPEGPAPPAPEFLIVTDTSPTFLRLTWTDVSDDEIGFRIERSLQRDTGFTEIDTVAAEATEYTDGTVESGGRFYYRVFSYNDIGASDPSDVVFGEAVDNATPDAPFGPIPANGALNVLPGTGVAWQASDPDSQQLTFRLFLGTSLAAIPPVTTTTDTSFVPPDSLELNRRYFWRVEAKDTHGATALSPIWGFGMKVERFTVDGGYFVMGDTAAFRHPGNPVWVDAFSIDKYEVTQQQYADFLNVASARGMVRRHAGRVYDINGSHVWLELQEVDPDSKILFDSDRRVFVVEPGWEDHPIVEVSWYGANAFSVLFNRRLPSEAEWELAARGTSSDLGDSTFTIEGDSSEVISVGVGYPYPWGTDITPRHANYVSSGDPFETVLDVGTTPVGFYDGTNHGGFATEDNSSPFGCFDMAGNAYEWVADWLQDYRSPHSPPADGELKVIRGGSWRKGVGSTLTWIRNATFPDSTDNSIGFRTAGPP